ncbi:MAG TPA: UDP-N-acetylglucosamine 2-epimerase (non-hydrolyzing) [Deltaproteobacteria bacterium]|nr:UDP-N-acetylglucosamine 2-epimerase (non-hydrolyzing) [Deltaproteobacteria bacterium]
MLTVLGTRPEALKMAPVLSALRALGVPSALCTTGQHPRLLASALEDLGLVADHPLPGFAGGDLAALVAHVLIGLGPVLDAAKPAWVVVHGDTTSALAAALAATYRQIPVAHVEAGLRTGDLRAPFPEEGNRRAIGALASLHLAPTSGARDNLVAEGIAPEQIHVTGNPVVDALQRLLPSVRARSEGSVQRVLSQVRRPQRPSGSLVLVTLHRRESQPEALDRVCRAVARLATRGHTVLWPLHPAPGVALPVRRALEGISGVGLLEPLSHPGFLELLDAVDLVLTDSGGVQEEAALLGRPTLVLRSHTERPELLQTGVVELLDPIGGSWERVVVAAEAWLASPPRPQPCAPLGDGRAGVYIARILRDALGPS